MNYKDAGKILSKEMAEMFKTKVFDIKNIEPLLTEIVSRHSAIASGNTARVVVSPYFKSDTFELPTQTVTIQFQFFANKGENLYGCDDILYEMGYSEK